VTDHIETLHELGIELKEEIEEEGKHIDKIVVTKGLNDHPEFIKAMAEEVKLRIAHVAVG
jgi:ferrochelatase